MRHTKEDIEYKNTEKNFVLTIVQKKNGSPEIIQE